jgi:hypothetical protein
MRIPCIHVIKECVDSKIKHFKLTNFAAARYFALLCREIVLDKCQLETHIIVNLRIMGAYLLLFPLRK